MISLLEPTRIYSYGYLTLFTTRTSTKPQFEKVLPDVAVPEPEAAGHANVILILYTLAGSCLVNSTTLQCDRGFREVDVHYF